jgi:hypothetical protein
MYRVRETCGQHCHCWLLQPLTGCFSRSPVASARHSQVSSLVTELTEEERIILEYNQRIALFNRAPQDFPSFVRNGTCVRATSTAAFAAVPAVADCASLRYDTRCGSAGYQVRVLTKEGYVEQSDGLIYKVGPTPEPVTQRSAAPDGALTRGWGHGRWLWWVRQDYEVGGGLQPLDGQQVVFHYTAYNESGATIDSTYRKDRPAETRLGIGGMIPGFEEGIKSMKVGGKRRIVVPPELGPPVLPPPAARSARTGGEQRTCCAWWDLRELAAVPRQVGPSTFFSSRQFEVFDVELLSVSDCERKSFGMISKVVCAPVP